MHLLWFIQYIFSSLMKHKTENTHKTHYKAAVRLQWHDSMAQHGRLVFSCTRTLHMLPTQQTTSALCVRTQEVVGAQIINMRTGPMISVGLQCMFSINYSHSDYQIKWLNYTFIYTCILHRDNLHISFFVVFFFGISGKKIIFQRSFKLVF